jgi:CheY-like chemotaxis protein
MSPAEDTGRFAAIRLTDLHAVRAARQELVRHATAAADQAERARDSQRAELRRSLGDLERRGLQGRDRVLVVEDNPAAATALQRVLAGAGWAVTVVRSMAGAFERLLGGAYEVVVVDLLLPDGGGETIAIRARERGSRVVLTSGVALDDLERAGRATAAHALLAKPFSGADILRAVAPPRAQASSPLR